MERSERAATPPGSKIPKIAFSPSLPPESLHATSRCSTTLIEAYPGSE